MADLESTITDIVQGDDYDIIRDLTEVPEGQYLTEAKFSVKENVWDTTAIIEKTITSVISSHGIIEDTGAGDTIARIRFSVTNTETLLLSANYVYVFDIQVKTDMGKVYTPESGTLVAHNNITIPI